MGINLFIYLIHMYMYHVPHVKLLSRYARSAMFWAKVWAKSK